MIFLLPLLGGLAGCRLPGKPGPNHVPQRPQQVLDFDTLYRRNCQACHGVDGRNGMAVSLANPAYLAYAGADHIATITANGVDGSLMPAFATSAGGLLTDEQVHVLADGLLKRWSKPLGNLAPPPITSATPGDPERGEAFYRANCLRCHAPGAQSILNPTYLALISDGGLRSLIVAGKPEAGMPDWRGYPGGALTDPQVTDMVAFLASRRTVTPGQPFPSATRSSASSSPHNPAPGPVPSPASPVSPKP